jgi:uncharacterized Zn-binding protein involved in type VI secretion
MIPMPVQRMGDSNAEGGIIMAGIPTVLVEGRPIATMGMPVAPHGYNHYGAVTTASQFGVFCMGMPVTRMADLDSCGDPRIGGALTVFVGQSVPATTAVTGTGLL